MTETKQRIEIMLVPNESKPSFSIWKFLRRYLKPLIILLVAGALVGTAGAAFYWVSASRTANETPPPSQSEEQAETEGTELEPLLKTQEMDSLAAVLTQGETGYIEFSYLLEEEITRTEQLTARVGLTPVPEGFAEMPTRIAQVQTAIANGRAEVGGIRDQIALLPALLAAEDPQRIRETIEDNQLTMDIYLEELEQQRGKTYDARNTVDSLAQLRIAAERLAVQNEKLEAVLRGEEASSVTDQAAAAAIYRRFDRSVMFLNDAKAELLDVVQKLAEAGQTPPPSKVMALGILLAAAVGVFAVGLVVLLIIDGIRNAENGGETEK